MSGPVIMKTGPRLYSKRQFRLGGSPVGSWPDQTNTDLASNGGMMSVSEIAG